METEEITLSPSKQSASKTLFAVFQILKAAGGSLTGKEVLQRVSETVQFNEWETQIYEKTGYIRWRSILHFYTVDAIKAGYLRKVKGTWYLTDEGEKAMKFGPVKLIETASVAYRAWVLKRDQANAKITDEPIELKENQPQAQKANLELLEEQAISGIKEFINSKNAYEFQDLVAALLRSMKYYTPYVSPKGRDGGLDIVAYRDPLGTTAPRIKVQVKHRPETAVKVDDIRSLIGLLNKDGDVGLFVTSGSFTSESERFARDSHIHVKLIDIDDLIALWREFYPSLSDEEKNLLPLHSVSFLGSNE